MALKYHIKANGDPGRCRAILKPCPLGASPEEHYASKEEARDAYEAVMKAQYLSDSVSEPDLKEQETLKQHAEADALRKELYEDVFTEDNMNDWLNANRYSLKYAIAQFYDEAMTAEYDRETLYRLGESFIAGKVSGIETDLKKNVEQLVMARHRRKLKAEANDLLKEFDLEVSENYLNAERGYREEILEDAVANLQEELRFGKPLTEPYIKRYSTGETS